MEEESSYFMLGSLSIYSDFQMIYGLIVMSMHNPKTLVRKQACSQTSVVHAIHSWLCLSPSLCLSHSPHLLFTVPFLGASLLKPKYWRIRNESEAASNLLHCLQVRLQAALPWASSALHSPVFATPKPMLQLSSLVLWMLCSGNITQSNMAGFSQYWICWVGA